VEFITAVFEELSGHSVDSLGSVVAETGGSNGDFGACDRRIESTGLTTPFREWDGIGALEKIRVVIGDGRKFQVSISQLVALAIVEDETLGLVFLEDSGEFKGSPVTVARLDLRGYLVDVRSFQCFASGLDKVKDGLATVSEALDFLGVTVGGLTIDTS
jgi:hypothetical protein